MTNGSVDKRKGSDATSTFNFRRYPKKTTMYYTTTYITIHKVYIEPNTQTFIDIMHFYITFSFQK